MQTLWPQQKNKKIKMKYTLLDVPLQTMISVIHYVLKCVLIVSITFKMWGVEMRKPSCYWCIKIYFSCTYGNRSIWFIYRKLFTFWKKRLCEETNGQCWRIINALPAELYWCQQCHKIKSVTLTRQSLGLQSTSVFVCCVCPGALYFWG